MTDPVPMGSNRPYLIRAIHDWITDNDCTPYVLVDATRPGVAVPVEHVDDGRIVLNVSHRATEALAIGNESIRFRARFGGRAMDVHVPVPAVLAIYARENGQGMMFPPDDDDGGGDGGGPGTDSGPDRGDGKPNLKIVR